MLLGFNPHEFAETAEQAARALEAWSERRYHSGDGLDRLTRLLSLITCNQKVSPQLTHIALQAYKAWSKSQELNEELFWKKIYPVRNRLARASVEMTNIEVRVARELREFCMALASQAKHSA